MQQHAGGSCFAHVEDAGVGRLCAFNAGRAFMR